MSSAVNEFASNWTTPEFQGFVQELADLVDSFDIQPGSDAWRDAEWIWARVVELEKGFWPDTGN
jgi:thiaminase